MVKNAHVLVHDCVCTCTYMYIYSLVRTATFFCSHNCMLISHHQYTMNSAMQKHKLKWLHAHFSKETEMRVFSCLLCCYDHDVRVCMHDQGWRCSLELVEHVQYLDGLSWSILQNDNHIRQYFPQTRKIRRTWHYLHSCHNIENWR